MTFHHALRVTALQLASAAAGAQAQDTLVVRIGQVGRLALDAHGEMKNPALTFSRFVDGKKTPLN